MNCYEFEMTVLVLARNQLIDAAARVLSLRHTENCARCAGRLAFERSLLAATRAVVAELASEEAPARVEAKLLETLHEHSLSRPAGNPEFPGIGDFSSRWRPTAVAATILILASATAIFWLYSPSLQRERGPQQSATGLVIQPEPPVQTVERESASDHAGVRPQRRMHRRTLPSKSIAPEVVTEFYPLVEAEDFEGFDSLVAVQVVRVELPASALAAAGMSVSPEISSERIRADVVLGPDGLARAIRFVR